METTPAGSSLQSEMMRKVQVSNISLRKLFARYNTVKATLKLLESHPATPQMENTIRLRIHKEWLYEHICGLLKQTASGAD